MGRDGGAMYDLFITVSHRSTPSYSRLNAPLTHVFPPERNRKMSSPWRLPKWRLLATLQLVVCLTLVIGAQPAIVQAAPQAPNACSASPSGLPDVIERTDFCVYFDHTV